ncbi:MAG TPA: hypothetical protein VER11_06490 [Polyangiaceae bacterium]|nr:hypothetical protein [Polyangiaceae bacterium]
MMRVTRLVPTMMVVALVAGCGGGQTGDLSGENGKKGGTTGSSNGCDDQLTEISLDEMSALGFDAASVLAFATQRFETDLAWQTVPSVVYSPSASASRLTLTLASQGKAWFVHSVPAPPANGQGGGLLLEPICPPDRLRLGVRAELQSADGALAESFDASLEARSPFVATLEHALVPEQVAGTFAIVGATPPAGGGSASVKDLDLSAVLTPGGMAGTLTGQLTTMNSQVASSSIVIFARFPSDARCAPNPGSPAAAVPVSPDNAALGQTGNDALSVVNGWKPIALTWADGAHGSLELQLSELGSGCVQVASSLGFDDPALPAATVVYPVRLKAVTADGRWQGDYPASLVTWPNANGSGFSERIELNETFVANEVAATGFGQAAIPSGTQRLNVRLEALFEAENATGKVSLDALTDPPCVTNPEPPSGNSAPGCSGTEVTPVLGATWPG